MADHDNNSWTAGQIRQLTEQRFQDLEKRLTERFGSIEKQIDQRFKAAEEKVATALSAAEKALDKDAAERLVRDAAQNEWQGAFRDMRADYAQKTSLSDGLREVTNLITAEGEKREREDVVLGKQIAELRDFRLGINVREQVGEKRSAVGMQRTEIFIAVLSLSVAIIVAAILLYAALHH